MNLYLPARLPIDEPLLLEGTGLGLQAVQRLARQLGAQLLGEVQELCVALQALPKVRWWHYLGSAW